MSLTSHRPRLTDEVRVGARHRRRLPRPGPRPMRTMSLTSHRPRLTDKVRVGAPGSARTDTDPQWTFCATSDPRGARMAGPTGCSWSGPDGGTTRNGAH